MRANPLESEWAVPTGGPKLVCVPAEWVRVTTEHGLFSKSTIIYYWTCHTHASVAYASSFVVAQGWLGQIPGCLSTGAAGWYQLQPLTITLSIAVWPWSALTKYRPSHERVKQRVTTQNVRPLRSDLTLVYTKATVRGCRAARMVHEPDPMQSPGSLVSERPKPYLDRLAQSRWGSVPASSSGPTDPVLRANPFPEVTDPACRLPLPTLFYWPEAVHLGDLLRLWVRPEARVYTRPPDFQGPASATPASPWSQCFIVNLNNNTVTLHLHNDLISVSSSIYPHTPDITQYFHIMHYRQQLIKIKSYIK